MMSLGIELSGACVANEGNAAARVILLHGVWMRGFTMRVLARRLRAMGWQVQVLDYHSVVQAPHQAQARLRALLEQGGPAHVVAHSLGGLVALDLLAQVPQLPVQRVVCLGTPLTGSDVARQLQRKPLTRHALGRSMELLCAGVVRWPEHLQVGMVAGVARYGLGRLWVHWQQPHDGSVAVAETLAPQLCGHTVLPVGHSGLLLSAQVARQVDAFLRHGCFDGPADARD